ncbi:GspE/PulE family protein [bacterium]|nr:GspE/PulE family protein [bacterium]
MISESTRISDGMIRQTGDLLVQKDCISIDELNRGLHEQKQSGGHLGEILYRLSRNEKPEIMAVVADKLGCRWVRPDQIEIEPELIARFPARLANHYHAIPVGMDGPRLVIAHSEPQKLEIKDEIELLINCPVCMALATRQHIDEAIRRHYGVGAETLEEMQSENDPVLELEGSDLHSLDEGADEASIIRFVNQIILEAHRLTATDIHFEPGDESFRIRYRIDGMLEPIHLPIHVRQYQNAIISRIKVMARLNISEQRLPQDGRIQVRLHDESLDLRVSVLPTPKGEALNLRLLRRASLHLGLHQLGFEDHHLKTISAAANRPNGIIIVTGPTGSGKTTTLYALLDQINSLNKKIITIEDPIEYQLAGVLQMQVHEEIGFTFARALRSILRHDPDVVLVGEIRDAETAEIAIRMAMTGHLVFSTLHTNDAASTIVRLLDMNLEPYLLASTIHCVIAQRLVRLNCPHCRVPYPVDAAIIEAFSTLGLEMPKHFYRGQGCETCRRSGFIGRTSIQEVYPLDEDFGALILEQAPASKFRALARRKNIRMMAEEGWQLVLAGRTTTEEILRVTQAVET